MLKNIEAMVDSKSVLYWEKGKRKDIKYTPFPYGDKIKRNVTSAIKANGEENFKLTSILYYY